MFLPEDFGVPSYAELIFVANTESAASEKYSKVFGRCPTCAEAIQVDPDGTFALFIQGRETLLDTPLNRKAWVDTVPKLTTNVVGYDAAQFEEMEAYMMAAGLIGE